MAANDYHVIIYQILAYLYNCLKNGQGVNIQSIEKFKVDSCVNEKYWQYILRHLHENGFIEGVCRAPALGNCPGFKCTADFGITPAGIEYLMENSLMQKAKHLVLEVLKSSVPKLINSLID